MFKFNDLKSVHVEITTRCQASCPMCSRNYHGGLENPNLKINDWTIDDFRQIFTQEVLLQLESIYFCGNFGDPIINNDLIDMCKYSTEVNPNINIRIHTNGAARNVQWWKNLYHALPKNHVVIFGIDGLEDTHHLYRIGTTYEQVINNARTFIYEGGIAEWAFIKFKHNEHQVEEARERSKKEGFNIFTIKNSTRFLEPKFSVYDKQGNTIYFLEPPSDNKVKLIDKKLIDDFNNWTAQTNIECYVQQTKEVYIDATKTLFPCCFLASAPYNYFDNKSDVAPIREKIKIQYNDLVSYFGGVENLNLSSRSLKEIINSKEWASAWDIYWGEKKLITCARTCGKHNTNPISQSKDQFIQKTTFK